MFYDFCLYKRIIHVHTSPNSPPENAPSSIKRAYIYIHYFWFRTMVDCSYLTEIGKVDIYWTGSRLTQLPPTIPPVGKNISRQAVVPWRYHFNTGIPSSLRDCLDLVTFSYTTVWWTWEDWENMLDWMALHGINFPL